MTGSRTRTALVVAAIVAVGAALRLDGVAEQPLLSDEEWVAATAVHFVESGQLGPTMWYHPPLRNVVVWAAGEAFGYGPLALRGTSLLLGILTIPLVALLLHALTRDRAAALLAAFLVAVEQVHVTFSRQAIQETWTTFLLLLGVALAVGAWRRGAAWLLPLSGVAFGLGVASKFHALFPLAACGAAGAWLAWRERSAAKAAWVAASLGALPALVFLLVWAPWFARGYGFLEWVEMQRVLLAKMATHTGNPMDQVIDTSAWQWFLRPMGYGNFVLADGVPFVTISWSNPVVWLAVLPATIAVARRALARGAGPAAAGDRFLLALFAASYLPLALTTRPIWLLSALAVIPFAIMLVAVAAVRLASGARWGRPAVAAWAAAVFASSIAIYPMAIGRAEAHPYLRPISERFRPAFEAHPPGR